MGGLRLISGQGNYLSDPLGIFVEQQSSWVASDNSMKGLHCDANGPSRHTTFTSR